MKHPTTLFLALALLVAYYVPTAFGLPIEAKYQAGSYEEAKSASSYIRFHMKSIAFGRIRTRFNGFVKDFSLSGSAKGKTVEKIALRFPVKALDSNNALRDKRMRDFSLAANRHPVIEVSVTEPVPVNGKVVQVPGQIRVRGKSHPITLTVAVMRIPGGYLIMGESALSMAALDIPKPSLVVARVEDRVRITFEVVVGYLTVGSR